MEVPWDRLNPYSCLIKSSQVSKSKKNRLPVATRQEKFPPNWSSPKILVAFMLLAFEQTHLSLTLSWIKAHVSIKETRKQIKQQRKLQFLANT